VFKNFYSKLILVQEWIEEKRKKIEIEQKLETLNYPAAEKGFPPSMDYSDRFETIVSTIEMKFEELSKSHSPGSIQLVNSGNYTKLIQLLIVLRDLQTTYKKGTSPNQLFKSFSSSDIASLLQHHFSYFQNKKINTAQKEITAVNTEMDYNQESIKELNKALAEFFFEKYSKSYLFASYTLNPNHDLKP
jgi:hypothetical protein